MIEKKENEELKDILPTNTPLSDALKIEQVDPVSENSAVKVEIPEKLLKKTVEETVKEALKKTDQERNEKLKQTVSEAVKSVVDKNTSESIKPKRTYSRKRNRWSDRDTPSRMSFHELSREIRERTPDMTVEQSDEKTANYQKAQETKLTGTKGLKGAIRGGLLSAVFGEKKGLEISRKFGDKSDVEEANKIIKEVEDLFEKKSSEKEDSTKKEKKQDSIKEKINEVLSFQKNSMDKLITIEEKVSFIHDRVSPKDIDVGKGKEKQTYRYDPLAPQGREVMKVTKSGNVSTYASKEGGVLSDYEKVMSKASRLGTKALTEQKQSADKRKSEKVPQMEAISEEAKKTDSERVPTDSLEEEVKDLQLRIDRLLEGQEKMVAVQTAATNAEQLKASAAAEEAEEDSFEKGMLKKVDESLIILKELKENIDKLVEKMGDGGSGGSGGSSFGRNFLKKGGNILRKVGRGALSVGRGVLGGATNLGAAVGSGGAAAIAGQALAVGAAGYAGYKAGQWIDKKTGASTKIGEGLFNVFHDEYDPNSQTPEQKAKFDKLKKARLEREAVQAKMTTPDAVTTATAPNPSSVGEEYITVGGERAISGQPLSKKQMAAIDLAKSMDPENYDNYSPEIKAQYEKQKSEEIRLSPKSTQMETATKGIQPSTTDSEFNDESTQAATVTPTIINNYNAPPQIPPLPDMNTSNKETSVSSYLASIFDHPVTHPGLYSM